jgi:hypothetical protein
MTPAVYAVLDAVIRSVAQSYARRVWWLSYEDFYQQAWLATMVMNSESELVVEDTGLVYRQCSRYLSRYCWGFSAPVTAGTKPSRKKLQGATRVEFYDEYEGAPSPETLWLDVERPVEEQRIREELRHRFYKVAEQRFEKFDYAVITAVAKVLLENWKSSEAAKASAVPVAKVYRYTEWMLEVIPKDRVVRELLVQLTELEGGSERSVAV